MDNGTVRPELGKAMAEGTGKRPPGRPEKEIDPQQVYKLAKIGCTLNEIGDIVGCSDTTLSRRFRDVYTHARAEFKSSLRRAQYVRAVRDKSDTMLVHLGKNYLGQADKIKSEVEARTTFGIDEGMTERLKLALEAYGYVRPGGDDPLLNARAVEAFRRRMAGEDGDDAPDSPPENNGHVL